MYEPNAPYCYQKQSECPRCSVKKSALRNFANFTGKHPCQRLFFNEVVGLRPATLLKKSLWYRCFPVNFVKFLRTPFLQNTSGRLLLFPLNLLSVLESVTMCVTAKFKQTNAQIIQNSIKSICFLILKPNPGNSNLYIFLCSAGIYFNILQK